ncbi:MAG: LuxR family transcriptional regulator [Rhodobacteraceae bacterium HLUCCA08]|nr:MAG: LuxR family transcriptional regulator [Rhodobacteraceae bacterium HLUCCA08]
MSDLVTQLEALTNAPSVENLWQLHCDKLAEIGFDRLIYGFTRYRSGGSLGDPQDWIILTNHGDDYMEGFIGQGLYYNAPMLDWALRNEGAASWAMIGQNGTLDDNAQKVVDFNKKHGVTAGYTVSFRSVSERTKGAMALTARAGLDQPATDALWAEKGREIIVMCNVVHLKLLTLPYAARPLTKRQREVLQWVGDGKTTADIALLLELTPATVEKHLRLAREALDVETTAQAVLKAAFYNQMFVLGDDNT